MSDNPTPEEIAFQQALEKHVARDGVAYLHKLPDGKWIVSDRAETEDPFVAATYTVRRGKP